jgi:hypothetical protein
LEINDKLTIYLDLNSSLGDLDLYLYESDGITLINSSANSGHAELLEMLATVGGNYLLKVQPDPGQFSRYSLSFNYEVGSMDFGKNSSLAIVSGTGGFSPITPGKNLRMAVGSSVTGTILLRATVSWQSSEIVPLIATDNWEAPSSSFFEGYSDLPKGVTDLEIASSITAPSTPGTYYLIFAFRNESSAEYIASATADEVPSAKWGDGNDISSLS